MSEYLRDVLGAGNSSSAQPQGLVADVGPDIPGGEGANKGFWRKQLKDRFMRFAKMYGNALFDVELENIGRVSGHGKIIDAVAPNVALIRIEGHPILGDIDLPIPSTQFEVVDAIIPDEDYERIAKATKAALNKKDSSKTTEPEPEPNADSITGTVEDLLALPANENTRNLDNKTVKEIVDLLENTDYGKLKVRNVSIVKSDGYPDDVFVNGEILDENDNKVGYFFRRITKNKDGSYSAGHTSLNIEEESRGTGFGTKFSKLSEAMYKKLGISKIEITAADENGAYTWAKAGYDWNGKPSVVISSIRKMLGEAWKYDPDQMEALKGILERFDNNEPGSPNYPTPKEIADLPIGKEVLNSNVEWEGVKRLDVEPEKPAQGEKKELSTWDRLELRKLKLYVKDILDDPEVAKIFETEDIDNIDNVLEEKGFYRKQKIADSGGKEIADAENKYSKIDPNLDVESTKNSAATNATLPGSKLGAVGYVNAQDVLDLDKENFTYNKDLVEAQKKEIAENGFTSPVTLIYDKGEGKYLFKDPEMDTSRLLAARGTRYVPVVVEIDGESYHPLLGSSIRTPEEFIPEDLEYTYSDISGIPDLPIPERTQDEKDAISMYRGWGYMELKNFMEDKYNTASRSQEEQAELQKHIDNLDQLTSTESLPEGTVLYRGLDLGAMGEDAADWEEYLSNLKPGDRLTSPGWFTSTTLDQVKAEEFATLGSNKDRTNSAVVMKITTKDGATGTPFEFDNTVFGLEKEVLLPMMPKFTVTNVYRDSDGILRIDLDYGQDKETTSKEVEKSEGFIVGPEPGDETPDTGELDKEEEPEKEQPVTHTFNGKTFNFSSEEMENAYYYISQNYLGAKDVTDEEGKEFNERMRALTDYLRPGTVSDETIPAQEKLLGDEITVGELRHSAPPSRFDEIMENGIRPRITDKVGTEKYSRRRFGVFLANDYTSSEAGKLGEVFRVKVPENDLRVDSGYTPYGQNMYVERTIEPEEIEHLGHIPANKPDSEIEVNDFGLHDGRGTECTICNPELKADNFKPVLTMEDLPASKIYSEDRYTPVTEIGIEIKGEDLESDEFEAIENYMGADYTEINAALLANPGMSGEEMVKSVDPSTIEATSVWGGEVYKLEDTRAFELISLLDSAFAKSSLKNDAVLYRGLHLSVEQRDALLSLKPGDILTDSRFMSATTSLQVANEYATRTNGAGGYDSPTEGHVPVLYRIKASKGTPAFYSEDIVASYSIDHLVIARNLPLTVENISKTNKGVLVIDLKTPEAEDMKDWNPTTSSSETETPTEAKKGPADWEPKEGLTTGKGESRLLDALVDGDYLDIDSVDDGEVPRNFEQSDIPSDQHAALQAYASTQFRNFNNLLRYGPEDMTPEKVEDVKEKIANLDELIDTYGDISRDTYVFRGMTDLGKFEDKDVTMTDLLESLNPGDVFSDPGFMSTSSYKDIALRSFGPGLGAGDGAIKASEPSMRNTSFWVINLPAGSKALGVPRAGYGYASLEDEVVLPRGSELKIVGIRKVPHIDEDGEENGFFNYFVEAELQPKGKPEALTGLDEKEEADSRAISAYGRKMDPIDVRSGTPALQDILETAVEAARQASWDTPQEIDEEGNIISDPQSDAAKDLEFQNKYAAWFVQGWPSSFEYVSDTNAAFKELLQGDTEINPKDITKLPSKTKEIIAGLELIQASPEINESLFRGIRTNQATLDSYQPGATIELPFSSFSVVRSAAEQYWEMRRSDIAGGGIAVEYELEPGSRSLPLIAFDPQAIPGEFVSAGRYEVVSVEKSDDPDVPTKVKIRHVGTFDPMLQRETPTEAEPEKPEVEKAVESKTLRTTDGSSEEFWKTDKTPGELKSEVATETAKSMLDNGISIEQLDALNQSLVSTYDTGTNDPYVSEWEGSVPFGQIMVTDGAIGFVPLARALRRFPLNDADIKAMSSTGDFNFTTEDVRKILEKANSSEDAVTEFKLYKELTEFERATMAASTLITDWATSSNGSNIRSLAIQDISEIVFDTKNARDWNSAPKTKAEVEKIKQEYGGVLSAFLQAQYEQTQKRFKEAGVTEVVLYRGIDDASLGKTLSDDKLMEVDVQSRPLSSWSTSADHAYWFATGGYDSEATGIDKFDPEDDHKGAVLLRRVIPVEQILSNSFTGVGSYDEREMVVIGGEMKAEAVGAVKEDNLIKVMRDREKSDWNPLTGLETTAETKKTLVEPGFKNWIKRIGDIFAKADEAEQEYYLSGWRNKPTKGNILQSIFLDMAGYNDKPKILSAEEFDALDGESIYRGFTSNEFADDYINSDIQFAGEGYFGNGTYTTNKRETTISYTGTENVSDQNERILEMKLAPDANAVSFDEVTDLREWATEKLQEFFRVYDKSGATFEEYQDAESRLFNEADYTNILIMLGIDAVRFKVPLTDKEEYYTIILNRGKVIVRGKS